MMGLRFVVAFGSGCARSFCWTAWMLLAAFSTGVNFKFDIVFEESDTLVIGVEVIA